MTKEFNNLFPTSDFIKAKRPYYEGNTYLSGGEIKKWTGKTAKVKSPVLIQDSDEENVMGAYYFVLYVVMRF